MAVDGALKRVVVVETHSFEFLVVGFTEGDSIVVFLGVVDFNGVKVGLMLLVRFTGLVKSVKLSLYRFCNESGEILFGLVRLLAGIPFPGLILRLRLFGIARIFSSVLEKRAIVGVMRRYLGMKRTESSESFIHRAS